MSKEIIATKSRRLARHPTTNGSLLKVSKGKDNCNGRQHTQPMGSHESFPAGWAKQSGTQGNYSCLAISGPPMSTAAGVSARHGRLEAHYFTSKILNMRRSMQMVNLWHVKAYNISTETGFQQLWTKKVLHPKIWDTIWSILNAFLTAMSSCIITVSWLRSQPA